MANLGVGVSNAGLQFTNLTVLREQLAKNPAQVRAYIHEQYEGYTAGRGVEGIGARFTAIKNFLAGGRYPADTPQGQVYAMAREELAKIERQYNAQAQIRGTRLATDGSEKPDPVKQRALAVAYGVEPPKTDRNKADSPRTPRADHAPQHAAAAPVSRPAVEAPNPLAGKMQRVMVFAKVGGLDALEGVDLSNIDDRRGPKTNASLAKLLEISPEEVKSKTTAQLTAAVDERMKDPAIRTAVLAGIKGSEASSRPQVAALLKDYSDLKQDAQKLMADSAPKAEQPGAASTDATRQNAVVVEPVVKPVVPGNWA